MGRRKLSSSKAPKEVQHRSRVALYSPPWLILLVLPWLAVLARWWWSTTPMALALAAASATVAAVGLTAFTAHVFRARGESIRVQAAATVGVAGAWLVVAIAAGPQTRPVMDLWIGVGFCACLAWNIRMVARGDGSDEHRDDDAGLMQAIEVAGRAGKPKLEAGGARVRVPAKLERGKATVRDLQDARGRIASYAGVRLSGVRVEPHDDDYSRGDIVITPRDLLKETVHWPGPHAPGQSIAVELPVGRYEDGDPAKLWLPGDPKAGRNSMHLAVMGMSGSGKGEGVLTLLAEAVTRPDVAIVYCDHVKGVQTVSALAPGIGLLCTEKDTAVAAFKRLPAVVAHRTQWLGQRGFKQWLPGCGLKFLIVVFEEAADFVSSSETFVKLTEQARSAGISLIPSQQRMSHDRMDTSARYNLGGGWCFGTGDSRSAEFALSPGTIDAGAAPESWKDTRPGYSYLEAAGVPESRWPVPLRAYLGDAKHHAEVVAEWCTDPGLDEVTAAAFGQVYAEYRRQVAEQAASWQTTPSRLLVPASVKAPADVQDAEMVDVDDELQDLEDEVYGWDVPANPEPGFMDTADGSQPIAEAGDDPDIEFGPLSGAGKPGTAAARRALREALDAMRADGREQVSTRELVDLRRQIQRSPSWLTGELARLVGEGYLVQEPDRGVYAFAEPVPVPA